MIGVCMQLDPVGGRRRWALRVSVNECGDGAVLMWLRRVRRGHCEACAEYARVLLVPEEGDGTAAGRCRGCVMSLVLVMFQESTMAGAVSALGATRRYEA